MKQFKLVLALALAICCITTVSAQIKTSPKKQMEKGKLYSCPMKCEGSKTYNKPGKCPKCKMKLQAKNVNPAAAMYQCPMKCEGEKMYAQAGKCPKCNMNLKAATEATTDEHKGHNHN